MLPAATEILYAIGAGDAVVGITHECDFPQEACHKPSLIRPRIESDATPSEVDSRVRDLVERGESIYVVDSGLFVSLSPDLIITQDLCHVCAASPETLAAALARLPPERMPRVVTFTPHTLSDVWGGIVEIGVAAGHASPADELAARLASEVTAVQAAVADVAVRPRVLCVEWFDPPYVAGHWVPEMVRLAGGIDVLGREGHLSVTVSWPEIFAAQPEVLVLMSCGYDLQRNLAVWASMPLPSGLADLPAVKNGRVYAVDANAYFSRPGPRLTQGVALLGHLFHPHRVRCDLPLGAFAPIRGHQVAAGSART